MRVSVALASYNGEKFIQEQLLSIINQSHIPDEIVISDDSSNDQTIAIIKELLKDSPVQFKILENKINLGLNKNFSNAVKHCSGEIIFLADQDDLWLENKIEKMLPFFNTNNIQVVICDGHYLEYDLKSDTSIIGKAIASGRSIEAHCAGSCTAIRKEFLDLILPYNNQDVQYDIHIHHWANLLEAKKILKESLQLWRIHGGNATLGMDLSSSKKMGKFEMLKTLRISNTSKHYLKNFKKFSEDRENFKELYRNKKLNFLQKEEHYYDKKLSDLILAFKIRAKIRKSTFLIRVFLIMKMISKNYYFNIFHGYKSILKDILVREK